MAMITYPSRYSVMAVSILSALLLFLTTTTTTTAMTMTMTATTTTTHAFGIVQPTRKGIRILASSSSKTTTQLEAFSFHSSSSLVIIDNDIGTGTGTGTGIAVGEPPLPPQAASIIGIDTTTAATTDAAMAAASELSEAFRAGEPLPPPLPPQAASTIIDHVDTTTTIDAATAAVAAASESSSSFTDSIDFVGDPTIRTLFLVFGGVVAVLAGLSVLSQKFDAAIENVVDDFESTLRTNPEFRSKWREIELQLRSYDDDDDNDDGVKRKQKLFDIMEELQEKEPALMKRINAKIESQKTNSSKN